MKAIILTLAVLSMAMTTNAQVFGRNKPAQIEYKVTNKQRKAARKRFPSYKESRKKNKRTNIVCGTIFATCLGVWFNVDRISNAVKSK